MIYKQVRAYKFCNILLHSVNKVSIYIPFERQVTSDWLNRICYYQTIPSFEKDLEHKTNQSVENAGMAFVRRAHERNMRNKYGRTRQRTKNFRDELI